MTDRTPNLDTVRTADQAQVTPIGRRAARGFDRLTADEARRALYIDFEGEKDKAPVLLGTLRQPGKGGEPFVHQVIVDPVFVPAGPGGATLHDAVANLVHRAEAKDRRIVAWTEHELAVVRTYCADDPGLVERFERRYVNARRVAERWMNKLHRDAKPAAGRLVDYLALIDYPLPGDAAGGEVGETIRAMRRTLEGGRALTANQQRLWARLLNHNRHDCAGMRQICLRAARELGRAS